MVVNRQFATAAIGTADPNWREYIPVVLINGLIGQWDFRAWPHSEKWTCQDLAPKVEEIAMVEQVPGGELSRMYGVQSTT
jgi:hypothetical protein